MIHKVAFLKQSHAFLQDNLSISHETDLNFGFKYFILTTFVATKAKHIHVCDVARWLIDGMNKGL